MRLTTIILLAIAVMLMLQSLFLVWVPMSGSDFQSFKALFGSDWYVNLLQITLGTAVVIAIGAVPYVILGFVRGTGHRGALIGIFVFIGISITCTLGLFAFFAMLSYG
jgi:cation transport ATPase